MKKHRRQWLWSLVIGSILFSRVAMAFEGESLLALKVTQVESQFVELRAGKVQLKIESPVMGVVRVRATKEKTWSDLPSWAVVSPPRANSQNSSALTVKEAKNILEVKIDSGYVVVNKATARISFLDLNRKVLLADAAPIAFKGNAFRITKAMLDDEHYYGLGDKAGSMDRRGRSFQNWNYDAYQWQESTDPLYKTIPFFLSLRKGQSYGVFLDSSWRSIFDFGHSEKDRLIFGADGGELDYYFLYGPTPKMVLRSYASLVGTMPLPPLWSLGYQQCRWSYYPESRVYEVVKLLRQHRIPTDVIYLDIDYQKGNAPFTVDTARFPHFEQMIRDFQAQGVRTIAITDLHLKKELGYRPYDEGLRADYFLKNPDGSVYVGEVWPGASVFPDFTRAKVREWWGSLYEDFVKKGIAGFWNDMNEPAIFNQDSKTMPLTVHHRIDSGQTLSHEAAHNIYGMQNARATYEGLLKLQKDERPFVLTRAAYAGTHRYAATWTGDNTSSWNHLRLMTPTLLSLGISGYSLVGADIGGFVGSPTAELLTRWIEVGAFTPMFRNHTAKDTADQEPWVHGNDHLSIRRRYIELRYRLLPYFYTVIEEASRTGVPAMRPMFLEYPEAERFYREADNGLSQQYLFGRDLLIAPRVTELNDPYKVLLPPGDWYDYWSGRKLPGDSEIQVNPALDVLPIYVRAGAILPYQPLVQSTSEKPMGPLELHVYPALECEGSVYIDDGHSRAYQRGGSARLSSSCEQNSQSLTVKVNKLKGEFQPWWVQIKVVIVGLGKSPKVVRINGRSYTDFVYNSKDKSLSVNLGDLSKDNEIFVQETL